MSTEKCNCLCHKAPGAFHVTQLTQTYCERCCPTEIEKKESWREKLQKLADLYQDDGYEIIIEELEEEIEKAYKRGKQIGYAEEGSKCLEHCEEARISERARIVKVLKKLDPAIQGLGESEDVLVSFKDVLKSLE